MEKLWASFKFEPSIYQSRFHRFVIEKIVNRFLRFLNENVSNVDLSSTKPEIATKEHDSYERPTFAVPTALEYEFFEGICGINDAALRFSTREYLAYLNMLEQ